MEYQTLSNLYLQEISDYLLPELDYEKLHSSCNGEGKEYAGETLKRMHDFFVDIYNTDKLGYDRAFVCGPAWSRAVKTVKLRMGFWIFPSKTAVSILAHRLCHRAVGGNKQICLLAFCNDLYVRYAALTPQNRFA